MKEDDDAPPPDGYARILLGEDHDPALADARLTAMVRRELARPEWSGVPADVRKAYLSLYGCARGPGRRKLTPAEKAAVRLAMAGGPDSTFDYDAAERDAIEAA